MFGIATCLVVCHTKFSILMVEFGLLVAIPNDFDLDTNLYLLDGPRDGPQKST